MIAEIYDFPISELEVSIFHLFIFSTDPDFAAGFFTYQPGSCDVISMHVPHAKGDEPTIGAKEFELMKDGAVLINCARGGCVDEAALINALQSGKISYAGIDVFENEPTPNPELLKQDNFSLTPHIGASTGEAQERIGKELAEKVIKYFNNN